MQNTNVRMWKCENERIGMHGRSKGVWGMRLEEWDKEIEFTDIYS